MNKFFDTNRGPSGRTPILGRPASYHISYQTLLRNVNLWLVNVVDNYEEDMDLLQPGSQPGIAGYVRKLWLRIAGHVRKLWLTVIVLRNGSSSLPINSWEGISEPVIRGVIRVVTSRSPNDRFCTRVQVLFHRGKRYRIKQNLCVNTQNLSPVSYRDVLLFIFVTYFQPGRGMGSGPRRNNQLYVGYCITC